MIARIPLFLILSLAALALHAGELPQKIAPGDDHIALQGSWSEEFVGEWTGIGFKVRTDAPAMNILMEDYAPGGEHPNGGFKNNYLNVRIDDQEPVVIPLQKGQTRYAVPGLDGKPHTVTVFRRTEPLFKPIKFLGLELPEGAQLLTPPAPADIRLQVIGDSISCGYGNETDNHESPFTQHTENGEMTYWAIAGRELGADVRCSAWSGRGVLRDRGGRLNGQLPEIWRQAVPSEGTPERSGVEWTPTIVVVNLGTNDIAKGIPPKDDFIKAYQGLIDDIRSTAPDADIYTCFGPMIGEKKHGDILTYLNEISAANERVYVVKLTNPDGVNGVGAHWHPNVKTNQKMARELLSEIREHSL
ncbi:SGNH/GDSL hydrolase family protein [Cerasicoccus fimbriatus]|uniref:SGNH/GDSL hydrolase family protein n=1 Tax=Cerasicoccus fimbriatus TaxID=3014554 RepID=UPI0022B44BCD|nr:SGNH/GDSL hydrolase family protein [Cerasicoccus sp. TK19100]